MSINKEALLQPVQHFDMHDDPLTHIETLHLVIWDKGLCIVGYAMNGNMLTTKVYRFPENEIACIEEIFINERLVAGPQPVTHVWIATERQMIVPEKLHHDEKAGDWLRKFHHIQAHEEIKISKVNKSVQASIIYPIDSALVSLIEKYFSESKIENISAMIASQHLSNEHDTADIIFLDKTVALTIRQKGKLLAHKIMQLDNINNLVYHIATTGQQYNIAQDDLKVAISGFCLDEQNTNELKAFFPKMNIPGSEQFSSFTFLSKLITCEL